MRRFGAGGRLESVMNLNLIHRSESPIPALFTPYSVIPDSHLAPTPHGFPPPRAGAGKGRYSQSDISFSDRHCRARGKGVWRPPTLGRARVASSGCAPDPGRPLRPPRWRWAWKRVPVSWIPAFAGMTRRGAERLGSRFCVIPSPGAQSTISCVIASASEAISSRRALNHEIATLRSR